VRAGEPSKSFILADLAGFGQIRAIPFDSSETQRIQSKTLPLMTLIALIWNEFCRRSVEISVNPCHQCRGFTNQEPRNYSGRSN
jgi:hypothetical protein